MAATKRNFILSSGIGVSADNIFTANTTNSVSTGTGSIVSLGGAGFAKSVSVGGYLQLFNSSNYTAFISSASGNTVYTLPASSPATGSSVLSSTAAGVMSWVPMTSGSGSGSVNSGTATYAAFYASSTNAVNENANIQFTGSGVSVGGNINSISTRSGSLYVSGGVGFTGNAFIGGTTTIQSSVSSISSSTGSLVVSGGVGIGGSLYVANTSRFEANTASVSTSTGAVIVSGGVGVGGSLYVGGSSRFSDSSQSNTVNSGAIVVTGGAGIAQSVSIGGRLQLFNGANYTSFVSSATGNTVYTLPASSPATGSSVLSSTAAGVLSWVPMTAGSSSGNTSQNIVINPAGNANVFHPLLFTPSSSSSGSAISSDSTITFNPSTEILNVSGLAITSGTASTNTNTGALVVRGGLGVTGQLSFATASFGFTGITTNPTMSFIGATSSSPITLTVLTDNSLNFEGSQGTVFSIDSNLSAGEIFSVSDISGLPIISASAGQTVTFNEFGGYTQFGNGSINSSSTMTGSLVVSGGVGITGNANIGGTVRLTNTTPSTSSITGAMTVSGGVGIGGSASISGRLQLFNSSNYTAFVSSATGNTVYTLPATSPAIGTSYLTSNSSGVMAWTAPNKANYVLSFGAGFTPTADSADSVSLNIPFAPDGTTKYYYVKRIDYRNETLSGGTGLSFYLQRHTSDDASWSTTNVITAGSGASFYVGAGTYSTSFTTIVSSAGVAGSIISGNYVRLYFTGVGSAANLSLAMIIEEQ